MTVPVPTGSRCTVNVGAVVDTFQALLPSWNPGDLAIVIAGNQVSDDMVAPAGWTVASSMTNLNLNNLLTYRIMQAGDDPPTFTSAQAQHWHSIAIVFSSGDFDQADPLEAVPAPGSWNVEVTNFVEANNITTLTPDALAIAYGVATIGEPLTLTTTPEWTEQVTDCVWVACGNCQSAESATKGMPVPGLTGACRWDMAAARRTTGMAFAVKPGPSGAGVTVDVPLQTVPVTAHVPSIQTITQVNVPEETYTITAFVPRAGAGTLVRVPVNTANVQQYPPSLPEGDQVFVPLHVIAVTERVPEIRTGARVPVPTFPKSGTPFPPEVGVATLVRVPVNTASPNNRVPRVGTGARVDIPELDTLIPIEYVPTVTATPGSFVFVPFDVATVQAFPPIVEVFVPEELPRIETDRDRLSLFIDEPSKLDFAGKSYMVASAEVDGDTLDGGRTTDGYIEVLMLSSEAQNIPELARVRLNGVNRTVSKIYDREGGMALLTLT